MTEPPSVEIMSRSTLWGGEIKHPAVQILTQLIVNIDDGMEIWVCVHFYGKHLEASNISEVAD